MSKPKETTPTPKKRVVPDSVLCRAAGKARAVKPAAKPTVKAKAK